MSKTPRDPSTLTDEDIPTMSEEERALYYDANAHRLDEIFDEDVNVRFEAPESATTTITVRLKKAELDELAAAAQLRGIKLSTFVRLAALGEARRDHAELSRASEVIDRKLSAAIKELTDVGAIVSLHSSAGRRGGSKSLSGGSASTPTEMRKIARKIRSSQTKAG